MSRSNNKKILQKSIRKSKTKNSQNSEVGSVLLAAGHVQDAIALLDFFLILLFLIVNLQTCSSQQNRAYVLSRQLSLLSFNWIVFFRRLYVRVVKNNSFNQATFVP